MARTIDHDAVFKLLLTTFFREFLELVAPELANVLDPAPLVFLDKESFVDLLDPDRREADLLVRVRLREQPAHVLIHLEHQAQPDPLLDRRVFRYFARFYDKFDLPVFPIVLCSYVKPRKPAREQHAVRILTRTILDFRYSVLQLNRLDWRDFLETTNPVAIALMARMHIAPADRWRVKAASLRLLVGARLSGAQRRLLSQFLDVYLRLEAAEEQAFQAEVATFAPPEREAVMELVTSWEQKGRAAGLLEGRVAGQRQVLEVVLTQKLGPLPADLLAQLQGLASSQLTALTLALPTLATTDDLHGWLATPPPPQPEGDDPVRM